MVRRTLSALLALCALALAPASCGDATSDTLCEPGTEVFCKCRGGFEGTKTCNAEGSGVGECTTADGPCPEIPDTTSATTSGVTTGAGGGGTGGTKELFEGCADGSECVSGTCEGFCTQACTDFNDCPDTGDCVKYDGGQKQVCAPYCTNQDDCAIYGEAVACGGAVALDDPMFTFAACATWGAELGGMPYGTLCEADPPTILVFESVVSGDCHLGLSGVQNVCTFGECSQACYEPVDCPQMDCSATNGNVGCCTSDPSCN